MRYQFLTRNAGLGVRNGPFAAANLRAYAPLLRLHTRLRECLLARCRRHTRSMPVGKSASSRDSATRRRGVPDGSIGNCQICANNYKDYTPDPKWFDAVIKAYAAALAKPKFRRPKSVVRLIAEFNDLPSGVGSVQESTQFVACMISEHAFKTLFQNYRS